MSEVPAFECKESDDYKIVYTMGAFGGLAPNDGRMILYVDRLIPTPVRGKPGQDRVEKIVRERRVEIHMSPATWKGIAAWMQGHVKKFERQFGTIPVKPRGAKEEPPSGLTV